MTSSTRSRARLRAPRFRIAWVHLLALAAVALGPALAANAVGTVVTALSGTATADGKALSFYQPLAPASGSLSVETDADSGCSLLHGEKLLVELGPHSAINLVPRDDGGTTVEVTRGQVRVTTERKRGDPRIEVRTQSAIVRPMTSTIHVEIDSSSGNTLITSIESRALVISADSQYKKSALLNSNQWVSVPMEGPPDAIKQVEASSAHTITGGVAMATLRTASLNQFSGAEGRMLLNTIAVADVPDGVSSPFVAPKGFAFANENPSRSQVGCDPLSCGLSVAFQDGRPAGPPICTGIPGEQCQR